MAARLAILPRQDGLQLDREAAAPPPSRMPLNPAFTRRRAELLAAVRTGAMGESEARAALVDFTAKTLQGSPWEEPEQARLIVCVQENPRAFGVAFSVLADEVGEGAIEENIFTRFTELWNENLS